ncbi:MAG: ComEC/Rec2 family competence protein [Cetobacterium sp.]
MKRFQVGILFFIIALLFFFRLNSEIFKNSIEVGDIVKIYGRVEGGKGKILKIDDKFPKERLYFIVDKVDDSFVEIIGEIQKIKHNNWGSYYKVIPNEVFEKENHLKSYFIRKIKDITKNYSIELENFYRATILGEGELIQNDLKEVFKYTGTSHILVISGLHIGIVIGGIIFVLNRMKIEKTMRFTLAFVILTIYIATIGLTPSILRAYIMGGIYILGNIIYEKVDSKKSLIVAFIISILIFPVWIYSLSFWMSYIAVFSIVVVYPKIYKFRLSKYKFINKIINIFIFLLTIQICMTPIFYIYFKTVPFLAFITNFIIVPVGTSFILISFLTLFLSNFYLGFLGAPLVNIIYIVLIKILMISSNIPYLTLEL